MKIDIYREDTLVVIRVIGRFDINEVHSFESMLHSQIESNPAVIAFRLRECTYIDSSAIVTFSAGTSTFWNTSSPVWLPQFQDGSFVRFMNLAKRHGIDMVCYDLNENIAKIFRISKLDSYVQILTEEQFLDKYVKR